MNAKILNVMNPDFVIKSVIGSYESAVLTRSWAGIGVLKLVLHASTPNAKTIDLNDILWFNQDSHKAYVVEKIEETLDRGSLVINITAPSIDSFIAGYITLPPEGQSHDVRTGTREQIVRGWVSANCIENPERAQVPIVLGEVKGLGDVLTEQTRHKRLDEEIARVLVPQDLGWGLIMDFLNRQFVFEVTRGVDRTTEAPQYEPRVIFGLSYGNLAGYHRVTDQTSLRTTAYVGGQGEGENRTILKVERSGSNERAKEVFIDARDLGDEIRLIERGHQILSEASATEHFEFETIDRQFRYEKEYDLGDFVTVVQDKDHFHHLQIRSVREVFQAGQNRVIPEFGPSQQTIKKAVDVVATRLSALEDFSLKLDDEHAKKDATWSSEKIEESIANGSVAFAAQAGSSSQADEATFALTSGSADFASSAGTLGSSLGAISNTTTNTTTLQNTVNAILGVLRTKGLIQS